MALVELVDGTRVDSASEAHRHETEARHLLRKPLEERRGWLADIEAQRGVAAAEALRVTMTKLHAKARLP